MKRRLIIAAVVVALAGTGAGWKWAASAGRGHASQPYRIAGWTWDESTWS